MDCVTPLLDGEKASAEKEAALAIRAINATFLYDAMIKLLLPMLLRAYQLISWIVVDQMGELSKHTLKNYGTRQMVSGNIHGVGWVDGRSRYESETY